MSLPFPGYTRAGSAVEDDKRRRCYVYPRRILWKTDAPDALVEHSELLVEQLNDQVTLNAKPVCVLHNKGAHAGVLLDFGVELQGGVQILTGYNGQKKTSHLRVRFGESAMEAMSELEQKGSTNDHARRDLPVEASPLGMLETGNTGFRFIRVDLLDNDGVLEIRSIRAIFIYSDLKQKGSFQCSDRLLNRIWQTGAYTVQLNMQHYLWDGIKRDRLVWIGDMYPETAAVQAVFGDCETVHRTLDFARDNTPSPQWMNGLISYSMWWVMIQDHLYMQNGNLLYLQQQKEYLLDLLERLKHVALNRELLGEEERFVDWSTVGNEDAVTAIFYSLLRMSLEAGDRLCRILGEERKAQEAREAAKSVSPKYAHGGSKQAAAMLVLAGLCDPEDTNRTVLGVGGAEGISTFLGYFVLCARALAGDFEGCLDVIRTYWGGMLKLGATTFWEEFDVNWLKNACRIDEIIPEGKLDAHGDTGKYCFTGYRKSLCHGWASGPTPWLTEYVLGIRPLEPGCRRILVSPHLGNLSWARGKYPTPRGILRVSHKKLPDGSIKSEIHAPEGIIVENGR